MRRILALAFAALAVSLPAAGAATSDTLPRGESLLFSLDAGSGTLVREGKPAQRRFALTLRDVDPRTTWFADRPDRDAGRIATSTLFGRWDRLGFRRVPPNAALVVDGAHHKRDTAAFVLRLRSYDRRTRTARFGATGLGQLTTGLDHLHKRLDRTAPPTRFGRASLFVDNVTNGGCTLGQPDLFALNFSPADYVPADGRVLPISQHTPLYAIYGTTYGGDGKTTFGVPNIPAPAAGMAWQICTIGAFPSRISSVSCYAGDIDLYATGPAGASFFGTPGTDTNLYPADGRTVTGTALSEGSLTLPDLPAPVPGTFWGVCSQGLTATNGTQEYLGQVKPTLPGYASRSRVTPQGQLLGVDANYALFALLGTIFGGNGQTNFALPALTAQAGTQWQIAVQGIFPTRDS